MPELVEGGAGFRQAQPMASVAEELRMAGNETTIYSVVGVG